MSLSEAIASWVKGLPHGDYGVTVTQTDYSILAICQDLHEAVFLSQRVHAGWFVKFPVQVTIWIVVLDSDLLEPEFIHKFDSYPSFLGCLL